MKLDPATYCAAVTMAHELIDQWAQIAKNVAAHCRYRAQGYCLKDCLGIAICRLDGLEVVASGEELQARVQRTGDNP